MSTADYFGIVAAICLAQIIPKNHLLALGLIATVANLFYLYIGK